MDTSNSSRTNNDHVKSTSGCSVAEGSGSSESESSAGDDDIVRKRIYKHLETHEPNVWERWMRDSDGDDSIDGSPDFSFEDARKVASTLTLDLYGPDYFFSDTDDDESVVFNACNAAVTRAGFEGNILDMFERNNKLSLDKIRPKKIEAGARDDQDEIAKRVQEDVEKTAMLLVLNSLDESTLKK